MRYGDAIGGYAPTERRGPRSALFRELEYGWIVLFFSCNSPAGFVGMENGVAHPAHGHSRHVARLPRTFIENMPYLLRIGFPFLPFFLNRLNPADQVLGHLLLAVDAADCRRAAFGVDSRAGFGGRKQFVPGKYRADFRAPRVGAMDALGVGHHIASLSADFVRRIAEQDGLAVGLAHPAAVEAGEARRFGRQVCWFDKNLIPQKVVCQLSDRFEKIFDTDFFCVSA